MMMSVEKSIYYHFVIFCLIIKTGSWSDSGSKRLFGVDAVFFCFLLIQIKFETDQSCAKKNISIPFKVKTHVGANSVERWDERFFAGLCELKPVCCPRQHR